MISKKKALELREKLVLWNKAYYNDNKPLVSDRHYDKVLQKLQAYEVVHPGFITALSPTQTIGAPLRSTFAKFTHPSKMYSLANAFNEADLWRFDTQIHRVLHTNKPVTYVMEEKIDGISVALHYEKGVFYRGVTRGNGTVGEDITVNLRQVTSIPHKISYNLPLEVRGEVYMPKGVFELLNKKGANFANPRNAAGGTLRQLQPQVVRERKLSAFFYNVPNFFDHELTKQTAVLAFLAKLGFPVNKHFQRVATIKNVVQAIPGFAVKRPTLPYNVDGVVIKVNDLQLHEDIGYTAKFPRAMIAFKFPAPTAQTTLTRIFATVGRTGKITYNAALAPVSVDNTVVRFATLHNASYVKSLNANVGDKVKIHKAGDIIPKVTAVTKKVNPKPWSVVRFCPVCKTELVHHKNGVDQFCSNNLCFGKQLAALTHFTSRNAMNIEGLGKKTIQKLLNHKLLSGFESVFKLPQHKAALTELPGFNTKSVANLCDQITAARNRALARFLFALGINHVGEKLAKTLATRFGSMGKLQNASFGELVEVRDLGAVVAKSLRGYFRKPANKQMLKGLMRLGVRPKASKVNQSDKLQGTTFVITGAFKQTRATLTQTLQANGANVTTTISSRTNYLLCGKNPGSKLKKAQEHNVRIIGMPELTKLLGKA